jgi:hypothetical protein
MAENESAENFYEALSSITPPDFEVFIAELSLSKKHRQGNQILRVPSSHGVDFI